MIELQGTDKRIQTLTVSLTNIDEIESKLKHNKFFRKSESTTIISNLDKSFTQR